MVKWKRWGCLLAISPFIILFAVLFAYFGFHLVYRLVPSAFTNSLNIETQQHLCTLFEGKIDEQICQQSEIYAYEFSEIVQAQYPFQTSYDQIQDDIGRYLVGCSDWESSASDGYGRSCIYDFKGDGAFPVFFTFSAHNRPKDDDGRVWHVCTFATGYLNPLKVFDCEPNFTHELSLYSSGHKVVGKGFAVSRAVFIALFAVVMIKFGWKRI